MPGTADGYYFGYLEDEKNFGCQTILVYNVADDTTIYPLFHTGNGVTVYAGHNGNSGTLQEDGKSSITLKSGEAIPYSAASESVNNLKNYWVTFVTNQSGGPKLFVNATNIDSIKDPKGADGTPVREVYLDEYHNYHHDIFFANIGDAAMTGLKVELDSDAQETMDLDEYWTIGATNTLAAFTTVNTTTQYGELANVAKIRLVPKRDANGNVLAGEIKGTVTISADGGISQTIKLTGTAGEPEITTETIRDGVKYVPYNSVIQTNVLGTSSGTTFTVQSGSLPPGITLYPNGKLYGMPTTPGEYTFTAKATFKSGSTDSKEFTITILDNLDANVLNAADENYKLLKKDSTDLVTDSATFEGSGVRYTRANTDFQTEVFHSQGNFSEFYKYYLDGQGLTEGTDYTKEEGSTKITILSQTFANKGGSTGRHTISAEFRTDISDTNTVHRTSQNYYVTDNGGNGGNNGNNNGGGDYSYSSDSIQLRSVQGL